MMTTLPLLSVKSMPSETFPRQTAKRIQVPCLAMTESNCPTNPFITSSPSAFSLPSPFLVSPKECMGFEWSTVPVMKEPGPVLGSDLLPTTDSTDLLALLFGSTMMCPANSRSCSSTPVLYESCYITIDV